MSIVKTNDKFPPEQVKEKLGALSVAMAKATDPANKLSLCSSRISTLIGIMDYKCHEWMEPGLATTLYQTFTEMVRDAMEDNTIHSDNPKINGTTLDKKLAQSLSNLEAYLNKLTTNNIEKKIRYMPIEGIELLKDYNKMLACRKRWKEASDIYMQNTKSWGVSNKAIADVADVLETIEMKYNLVVMPKNYSYNIDDLHIFKRSGSGGSTSSDDDGGE